MIQFDEHIFQMSWNHQLGNVSKVEDKSGQVTVTSRDQKTQELAVWKGNPLISGKSSLVKYYNLAG